MERRTAAGYFRVSQSRDDMSAPELYREEIERYCRYRDVRLAEVFADVDYSAFRGARTRPGLEELKRRRREFGSVVVPKLARFGRSVSELVQLFELFDRDGVSLVFLDLNVDTNTSQGRLLRHVMAAFAEYESDVKSDYARLSFRHVQSQGRPWGGRAPFGYERADKNYVVVGEAADVVRDIFARYLAGHSQYAIARAMNDAGVSRPNGGPWSMGQVGKMLDNPAYAGLCLAGGELVAATWPAIIDLRTWDGVQSLRRRKAAVYKNRRAARRGPYLLSGLVYCEACDKPLHHSSKASSRAGVYVCSDRVRDGGRCRGGYIDGHRVERLVTAAFLERSRSMWIPTGAEGEFHNVAVLWERAPLGERRRLLSLAIDRVVMVPYPGGRRDKGDPSRKKVRIEWARDETPVAFVSGPTQERRRRAVADSRADSFRAHLTAEEDRKRADKIARIKGYYAEWRAFNGRFKESARQGSSPLGTDDPF